MRNPVVAGAAGVIGIRAYILWMIRPKTLQWSTEMMRIGEPERVAELMYLLDT